MMRSLKIALGLLCLIIVVQIGHAQDGPPSVESYLVYYEDENLKSLGHMLWVWNVCFERFVFLNPDLEIDNIPYGARVRLPKDEPCYLRDQGSSMPRIKYFENGEWLTEPYYTGDVEYTYGKSIEEIAQRYDVCIEDLTAENYGMLIYGDLYLQLRWPSVDVFVPHDAQPCDNSASAETPPVRTVEIKRSQFTPIYMIEEFNICPEEFRGYLWSIYTQGTVGSDLFPLNLPVGAPPCYNEEGQRLAYFDESGARLDVPQYTDLPVYRATHRDSLPEIARALGVCEIDLLLINNFPDLPTVRGEIELFIPSARPCPDGLEARRIGTTWQNTPTTMSELAVAVDICPEVLEPFNPHFVPQGSNGYTLPRTYSSSGDGVWAVVPTQAESCFREHDPGAAQTIYDIERELNICYEAFIWSGRGEQDQLIRHDRQTLKIRHDTPPCYDQQGRRLYYPPKGGSTGPGERHGFADPAWALEAEYVYMQLHIFAPSDSVYTVSRQYNVCVHEILKVNPVLIDARPPGYATFIPNTRPCYDEMTGLPLIYEDDEGSPLPEPRIGEHLIYYGTQPLGYVSYYYNVCENRIREANVNKGNGLYLGWIIPTDRPPCYDELGVPINTVCYDRPVDMRVDYRPEDAPVIDPDGTDCYDLGQPGVVVWYDGRPYSIIDYYATLLESRAFTAWCYGVSQNEIDAINEVPEVLALLTLNSRAIPRPTRECYITRPEVHAGKQLHRVEAGETLASIAAQYDIPYWIVAQANGLDAMNSIWSRQELVIPFWPTWREVKLAAVGVVACAAIVVLGLNRMRRRKRHSSGSDGYRVNSSNLST
ncbi:MAG: LysM peptidoglycan-binding domain-containing protein [Chloroflexi bacterium]|nr:LysM peptidoglycan-binding domain-containing protein [Chloroflexota bacterium]